MNKLLISKILIVTLVLIGSISAYAATPQTMNYQGYLKSAAGVPFTGTKKLTFKIYDATTGGNLLWTEIQQTVNVAKGQFSVTLGSPAAPLALPFDKPYWLGVAVDAEAEMTPRQPLTTAPYAFRASVADSLAAGVTVPGAVPTVLTAAGSVQATANNAYILTGSTPATVTLPTGAAVGDVIKINAQGAGGYTFNLTNGQTISGAGIPLDHRWWAPIQDAKSWRSIASSADGAKLVALIGSNNSSDGLGVFTSSDGGSTWVDRGYPNQWVSVASSADGSTLVAVAYNKKIYMSYNSGAGWIQNIDTPALSWRSVASSADGMQLVAVPSNGFIYISRDGGGNWSTTAVSKSWTSVASSADGSRLVAVDWSGWIFISQDGGRTWPTQIDGGVSVASVACSADGTTLLLAIPNSPLYISRDGGTTWLPRSSAKNWQSVAVSADGSKMAASGFDDVIHISSDGGETWNPTSLFSGNGAFAFSTDGRQLVVTVASGGIYKTSAVDFSAPQFSATELVYAGNGQWQLNDASPVGHSNSATGIYSTISGGTANSASNSTASVGGGYGNRASGVGSTVAGGSSNRAAGDYSTVSGGALNSATGLYSTIVGGNANLAAGEYSLAAGKQAKVRAADKGTFVWADSFGTDFQSSGVNQFLIRALGGVGINTNSPAPGMSLDVAGDVNVTGSATISGAGNTLNLGSTTRQMINLYGTSYGIGVQDFTQYFRSDGNFAWYTKGVHSNPQGDPGTGGVLSMFIASNGNVGIGTAAPKRKLQLSQVGATELSLEVSDGMVDNRIWNLAAYGSAGSVPKLDFRIINDSGSDVPLTALSLRSNGDAYFAGNVRSNGTLLTSDIRLKTDIHPLENSLDKLLNLRGVSYLLKSDQSGSRKIGVIAQELEQEYPELVATDDNGMKSVAYANLTAVLIEAVKALKSENSSLHTDNATLKNRLDRLEKLLGVPAQ